MNIDYFGRFKNDDGDEKKWAHLCYPWRPFSNHPIHLDTNKNSMTNADIKKRAKEIGNLRQIKVNINGRVEEGILFFDSDDEPYIANNTDEDSHVAFSKPWQISYFKTIKSLVHSHMNVTALRRVEKTFEYLIPGDVIVQDYEDVFGVPDGFIAEEVINIDRNGEYIFIDTHCGQHKTETPEEVAKLTKEDDPKEASNRYTLQTLKSRDDLQIHDEFSEEENIEMTLQEVAEEVGVDVNKLRIKDK